MSTSPEPRATLSDILPDLLNTQFMVAEVYSAYFKWSEGRERAVWKIMLDQEMQHAHYLHSLLDQPADQPSPWPEVRLMALRGVATLALVDGSESALSRLTSALRLEHAEIDFGLETFALGAHAAQTGLPVYPGRIEDHYNDLLAYAHRYAAARDVAGLIARITEHFPDVDYPPRDASDAPSA